MEELNREVSGNLRSLKFIYANNKQNRDNCDLGIGCYSYMKNILMRHMEGVKAAKYAKALTALHVG